MQTVIQLINMKFAYMSQKVTTGSAEEHDLNEEISESFSFPPANSQITKWRLIITMKA